MIKVMTIVGTRPELIKMSRVISVFDKYTNHILVHTGQNFDYELNEIFFKELKIRKPNYFLGVADKNPASSIANIIKKADEIFEIEKPDALLLYGDTNSCLSVIAAKRRKIPIFHMEAGNRSFDQRVPEEINRKIIDHLSDVNMVLTEHSRRYLLSEGIRAETVFNIGSHMHEVLDFYMPSIKKSSILKKLNFRVKKYFVVSAHREENIDSPGNFNNFLETLEALYKKYHLPIVVSTHPRTRLKLEKSSIKLNKNIQFAKPFGFFDYIKLQMNALCVLSDSGTISEESLILNIAAVNIRNAHERPEGIDFGAFIMSGLKKDSVLKAVEVEIDMRKKKNRTNRIFQNDNDLLNVSSKILKIVLGYADYINRNVWFK